MAENLVRRCALLLVILLSGAGATSAAEALEYELRFDRPNSHLLSICIRATDLRGPAVEFAMPAWAPGAYRISDFAMMVQEVNATGSDGRPLAWRKTDKQTWRVELLGSTIMTLCYKLYGNSYSHTSVQYDDRHAQLAGPATWIYLVGGKGRPVRLRIHVPAGWRVATGLARAGENVFTAPDYDWLADSPIEISDFREQTFVVAGTTYHVVVHDVLGKEDFSQFTADTRRIVEAIVPWFSAVSSQDGRQAPFDAYWFLIHVRPGGTGGLEHLNSTQLSFSSDWSSRQPAGRYGTDYDLKLFVAAHEFYHAWNVKRLRPRPLGPFDYSREVYTPLLWHAEGITSYYGQLALVRTGLMSPESYLDSIGQLITEVESGPGRSLRSLEETSWDAWFRFTGGPVENDQANTLFSYYDGGQVMGHLLDFAVRQATNNERSLDDVMRLLYQRFALPKAGFEPSDLIRAVSEVAGKDLSDFFRRYVAGREVPPYQEFFAHAGIQVERRTDADLPWIGASWQRNEQGRARILNIRPGGPALAANLDRGDVVFEVNGKGINAEEFRKVLAGTRPGDTVRLRVNHQGELRELELKMGADPDVTYTLAPMDSMSESQRKVYRDWLGLR